jgi:hypothetical protein
MKDMWPHPEKLQAQIAECELIDFATDLNEQELFDGLVNHFKILAVEIERVMADPMPMTFLGRKTQEPFPSEEN